MTGLLLTLNLKDKEEGNAKGKLECRLFQWHKAKVILHITDNIPERECLEETGFHITALPPGSGPEERTRYDIYLSTEHFHNLTNPTENPIIDGGHFLSRSRYDRIEFNYWGL